ncbi:MAG: hypothetical protein HC798_02575 [Polaribacter sp.]|nr:hypothetical protein [Polaribacter sp.]
MKLKFFIFLLLTLSINGFSQSYSTVFNEDFNSINGWPTGNDDTRELYVSNGKYYFDYKKDANWRVSSTPITLNESGDFEISTSIEKISGVQDYGICFLYDFNDDDNYREFGITSGGYYRVAESKSGTYKTYKRGPKQVA